MGFEWVEYEAVNPHKDMLWQVGSRVEGRHGEIGDLVSPVSRHLDVAWQSPSTDRREFASGLSELTTRVRRSHHLVEDVVWEGWRVEPATLTRWRVEWV